MHMRKKRKKHTFNTHTHHNTIPPHTQHVHVDTYSFNRPHLLTAIDVSQGGEHELDDLWTQLREPATHGQFLQAGEDGSLRLHDEGQGVEERVKHEPFPVGLGGRRDG